MQCVWTCKTVLLLPFALNGCGYCTFLKSPCRATRRPMPRPSLSLFPALAPPPSSLTPPPSGTTSRTEGTPPAQNTVRETNMWAIIVWLVGRGHTKRSEQMHVQIVGSQLHAQIYRQSRLVSLTTPFALSRLSLFLRADWGEKNQNHWGKRTAWSPPRLA